MTVALAAATIQGRIARSWFGGVAWTPPEVVAARAAYWPSWRPATEGLLWSSVDGASELIAAGQGVPGSRTDPPLFLGPRLPHYALWPPDGERLCYVVPDGQSLVLKVWSGEENVQTLVAGAPLFPAWSSDSQRLYVHHANTLESFDMLSGERSSLSGEAAGFRTPATNPSGPEIGWAEVANGAVNVMEGRGDQRERLAGYQAGVALTYRPGTSELCVSVASSAESNVFGEMVNLRTGRRLVKGPFVAAWWAPDGSKFAAVMPTFGADGRYQVRLFDAEGQFMRAAEAFVPSVDTATMLSFFDQYALSHPFWSSDSRWFAMSGRFITEGLHPAFSDGVEDYVWTWDTVSGEFNHRLIPGTMVSFNR